MTTPEPRTLTVEGITGAPTFGQPVHDAAACRPPACRCSCPPCEHHRSVEGGLRPLVVDRERICPVCRVVESVE